MTSPIVDALEAVAGAGSPVVSVAPVMLAAPGRPVPLEARAPSPDANIGLGLLLLGGSPMLVLLLLWSAVRALVLIRRRRP